VQNFIWRKAIGFFFKNIIKYRTFAKMGNLFLVKHKKSEKGYRTNKKYIAWNVIRWFNVY